MFILEYLSVIGLSAFKVIPGVFLALIYGLGPIESFICVSVGAMIGIVFFTLFGKEIRKYLQKRKLKKQKEKGIPPQGIKMKKWR